MATDLADYSDQSSDKSLGVKTQTDLPRPLPAKPEGSDDSDVFRKTLNGTKSTPEPATPAEVMELPELKYSAKQIQRKFEHAQDFGVEGDYTKINAQNFENALRRFAEDPTNKINTSGRYHGEPAILIYNESTSLCQVLRPDGTYWTGWKLGPQQLKNVIERGMLGGG